MIMEMVRAFLVCVVISLTLELPLMYGIIKVKPHTVILSVYSICITLLLWFCGVLA